MTDWTVVRQTAAGDEVRTRAYVIPISRQFAYDVGLLRRPETEFGAADWDAALFPLLATARRRVAHFRGRVAGAIKGARSGWRGTLGYEDYE